MLSHFANLSQVSRQFLQNVSPRRATLLVLAFVSVFVGVGWMYVTNQEHYLVQRNFRLLHLWGEDIQQKIANYERVFQVAVQRMENQGSANNGSLQALEWADLMPVDCQGLTGNDHSSKNATKPIEQLAKNMCDADGLMRVSAKVDAGPSDAGPQDQVRKSSHLDVSFPYRSPSGKDIAGRLTIDIQPFLTRLVHHTLFSDVVIFDVSRVNPRSASQADGSSGRVAVPIVFQSGEHRMTWERITRFAEPVSEQGWLHKLFGLDESTHAKHEIPLTSGDHQFFYPAPGQMFQGFSHTFRIPGALNAQWILVGFVDDAEFTNDALAMSSTMLLGIMILGLAAVILLPLFHLKTLGSTDPLKAFHVLGVLLSTLLGAGLVTFLVLDATVYWDAIDTLKQNMETQAQEIEKTFQQELRSVLWTLDQFDHSPRLDKQIREVAKMGDPFLTRLQPSTESLGSRNIKKDDQIREACDVERLKPLMLCQDADRRHGGYYSDFLYAFWMDEDGSMRVNWARDRFGGEDAHGVGDNVDLSERQYVRAVTERDSSLWTMCRTSDDGKDNRKDNQADQPMSNETCDRYYHFFLEPIFSWTDGRYSVVASMPSRYTARNPRQGSEPRPWVAAMEFQFASLADHVVLPSGVGLAVVQQEDGRVLFHSQAGRNLREQFLVETDHDAKLRDLLAARAAGHVTGHYWGEPTSFYVLPMGHVPWSIVVFRNTEVLQSVNLVGLLVAGSIYGFWSVIIYLLVWLLLALQRRHRKAPWLWPNPEHQFLYGVMTCLNLVWFVVGLIAIYVYAGKPAVQLGLGAAIPIVWICAVVAVGWTYGCRRGNGGQEQDQDQDQGQEPTADETKPKRDGAFSLLPSFEFPRSYAVLLSSCLLILGVIPAYGCFASVLHHESRLFAQHQLMELYEAFLDSGKRPIENDANSGRLLVNQVALDVAVDDKDDDKSDGDDTANSKNDAQSDGLPQGFGVYPNVFLETDWRIGQPPLEQKILSSTKRGFYEQLMALFYSPFVPLLKDANLWGYAGEMWPGPPPKREQHTIVGDQTQRSIVWDNNGEKIILYGKVNRANGSGGASAQEPMWLRLSASTPFVPWLFSFSAAAPKDRSKQNGALESYLQRPGQVVVYTIIVLMFILWLWMVPKFVANRALFLSFVPPRGYRFSTLFPPPPPDPWSHRLFIGFPGQGKTPKAIEVVEEGEEKEGGGKRETTAQTVNGEEKTDEEKKTTTPLRRSQLLDLRSLPPHRWRQDVEAKLAEQDVEAKRAELDVEAKRAEREAKQAEQAAKLAEPDAESSKQGKNDHASLHLIIDHFDVRWRDPRYNQHKLEFLEWLATVNAGTFKGKPLPKGKDLKMDVVNRAATT